MTSISQARPRRLLPEDYRRLAQAHLDGLVDDADLATLQANEEDWIAALRYLRDQVAGTLNKVRATVSGPERDLVIADFTEERDRIDAVLTDLTGEAPAAEDTGRTADAPPAVSREPEPPRLQLSWTRAGVVAWGAGFGTTPEPVDEVMARLRKAGAAVDAWQPHESVALPEGKRAEALTAPVQASLGWLVALGSTGEPGDDLAPSALWLGRLAAWAVRLVAQGRMVPQLDRPTGDRRGNQGGRGTFAVRWTPALMDDDELGAVVAAMPGAVLAAEPQADARAVTREIVTTFVDAICRDAAARIEVPAPPPRPRTAAEVAEAVLGHLDGTPFEAPMQHGNELSRELQQWARSVTNPSRLTLVIQLDPPDEGNAWHLKTLAPISRGRIEQVEAAMSKASDARREAIKAELDRVETLYEPLMRGKASRRGEVILSQDEAWDLMTTTGSVLTAAGFDVRVPPLSRRKAAPSLRLTAMGAQGVVGSQQLTTVQWSAVFDDVELTAEDIKRLAAESRPLVKAHGRWVEVDHADLEAAAAALAERENRTRLSGADMLRYAMGLEDSPLRGGFSVTGEGWAADLLRSARQIPEHPPTQPEGFEGTLRSYQADALAWLDFLDSAGLGGCLALDMGLGKTPTMLAHLHATRDQGPALVIAPPAVVGNWASEATRFVPDLEVVVHHGANRADEEDVAGEVADADVVITTYGTAVRDIAALEEVRWGKVVLDEAQVIKNPASETAQQLRRLEAHTRVVLTGTPIENGLGDLWALMDFVNPGLLGDRAPFIAQLSKAGTGKSSAEQALRTLNGVLVFRRTKAEPAIAEELPDRIDELDHCPMTPEQIGLYQAVLDDLVVATSDDDTTKKKGAVLAAITALKQICNHPAAYADDGRPLDGRSGKLARLEEIVDNVFEAGERMLIFTHFATWGEKLAAYLSERTGKPIACYHGGLARGARDAMIRDFQEGEGAGALVLSLKAGGTGLNLTAASHVVLYDRWWNPAVEDQARDRAWRIGQTKTVVAHRLVCPGTVDERVEEVVAGKRRIADMALPKSSSVGDLDSEQLRRALGLDTTALLTADEFGMDA